MDDAMHQDYLSLLALTGDRTAGLGELLLEFGSPGAALAAPDERLARLPPATQQALDRARASWQRRRPRGVDDRGGDPLRERGSGAVHFLPIVDARYPDALRQTPDPPPWLFCRGDPARLARPTIAVVGARRASRAGLQAAGEIGRRLASRGYLVCSGLALGIDAAAHRGALESGLTAAVLACGLDRVSPRQHEALGLEVARSGCLLSELPFGTTPDRWRFPRRNRIISGLSQATIIVEAALPSGSLHTASAALEQGRDVYVLPWSVFHAGGRGGLRLLRDGALPITDLDDIDDHFPALTPLDAMSAQSPGAESNPAPGADGALILEHLGDASLSSGELLAGTGLTPQSLYSALAELELNAVLERHDGRYRRCRG
jgi:DNA processing protein